MNWPGEDLHCYVLQDYLDHHHTKLVIWNPPQPHVYNDLPHIASYRWVTFGQYESDLAGLPLRYRILLYGEMILGAPRQLLAKIRPNHIGADELDPRYFFKFNNLDADRKVGYDKDPFVPDSLPKSTPDTHFLIPVTSPALALARPYPGPYQLHFIRKIADIAQKHGAGFVLLYLPGTFEYAAGKIPELASWSKVIGPQYEMIGEPANVTFSGMSRERFLHFYSDTAHFNINGRVSFTNEIIPSILKAYDQVSK
jgi:hypothetical protein